MARDLIIELFDVRSYLQDKGINFISEGKEVTPGWIGLPCFWCDDRGHHLGINLTSNAVSCWRCGKKGITKLVRLLEKDCDYGYALSIMEKYQDVSRLLIMAPEYVDGASQKPYLDIPKNFEKVDWNDPPKLVKNFLINRGFHPETFLRNKVLYYGGHVGRFKFRLILPITYQNRLVSYLGRDLTGKSNISYMNLEDSKSVLPIKSTLYGFDDVPPGGNVIVVEGPIDQWKLGNGSVATYGTQWTMAQISLLRELHPNKVFVLFDSEDLARESAKRLSNQIWFCETEVLELDNVKDPGELTLDEGKRLMKDLNIS